MSTPSAYRRPKEPARIRRALLDAAARLVGQHGIAELTLQPVAEAAGVTKGGLLHHFPTKQALVDVLFADLIAQWDAEIDARMVADPTPWGRFTRAYVEAVFAGQAHELLSPWAALSMSLLTEPGLRQRWASWLEHRLEQHGDTDADPTLEVARLAADGAWLAFLSPETSGVIADPQALRTRLVAMSTR